MKKIFVDCDNSVGLEGKPMDDALALLYLMGCPEEAEIVGIGCNYGNASTSDCFNCTRLLLDETGRSDIPVLMGNNQGETGLMSPAAEYIVSIVNRNPGEIIYLGLGSLGNLYEACMIDETITGKIPQVVLMGGITEPLVIHGQPLHELNFSINGKASTYVLNHFSNITVITGNNCLPVAGLPRDEFLENLCRNENPGGMYVAQKCGYRFRDKQLVYGADVSYCWDGVAAAYILHPELFSDDKVSCCITEKNISDTGFLCPCDHTQSTAAINIPAVTNKQALQQLFYDSWLNLNISSSNADYSCFGLYLDKLIQPCVLIELSSEPAYGFQLLNRLKTDGYINGKLDPSGFYRNLKRMENDGYIRSESSSGENSRRTYYITDFGKMTLLNWKDSLEKYQKHIGYIVQGIEDITRSC